MFAGFASVGFSGSRSLAGAGWRFARRLAATAAEGGAVVSTGCAAGADAAARAGASGAVVFRASSFRRPGLPSAAALARRSAAFVRALAGSPSPCLVAFPGCACPAGLLPGSSWSSGFGSGTWASCALAAGLGVPLFVFLPRGVAPPPSWGSWVRVASGPLARAWSLSPTLTLVT